MNEEKKKVIQFIKRYYDIRDQDDFTVVTYKDDGETVMAAVEVEDEELSLVINRKDNGYRIISTG